MLDFAQRDHDVGNHGFDRRATAKVGIDRGVSVVMRPEVALKALLTRVGASGDYVASANQQTNPNMFGNGLADRLADEYLVGKDKSLVKSDSDRTEAIALYQESLPIRAGEAKIKIQFQMARLYAEKATDAGSAKSARDLFELVRTTSQVKELKRESNLRLAEFAESKRSFR